jgi:hypothetical protein
VTADARSAAYTRGITLDACTELSRFCTSNNELHVTSTLVDYNKFTAETSTGNFCSEMVPPIAQPDALVVGGLGELKRIAQ